MTNHYYEIKIEGRRKKLYNIINLGYHETKDINIKSSNTKEFNIK